MAKPPGLDFLLTERGPTFRVTRASHVEDAIFNAVETAIEHGVTVDEFRREAADCWRIVLDERQKADAESWRK